MANEKNVVLTWFKDVCDDVYVWLEETVPYPTTCDTANFCIPADKAIEVLPTTVKADENDWNYVTLTDELLNQFKMLGVC